jgi:cytochrome d ubiquinol oxidase subunit II
MTLQIIWFVLWGLLWAVYFVLDGFDLGAGILYGNLGKNEADKSVIRRTVGPVWGGNEVWLITAGGATFAAFPTTYALMFSYLYSALLIILFALIFRGVALEFRGRGEGLAWRKGWDLAICLGSFIPTLLFGVAFGNLFRGLPFDGHGYHGSLLSLINPYGLLTGLLFVLMFTVHGALWLAAKSLGTVQRRALHLASRLWYFFLGVAAVFLITTKFDTHLFDNYFRYPFLFILPLLAVLALWAIGLFLWKGKTLMAFYSSCLTTAMIIFTGLAGLYPNLIPSRLDPASSLTIFNSSSSAYTLRIMTVIALIFVPIVVGYQLWVYRVFRSPVSGDDVEEHESY